MKPGASLYFVGLGAIAPRDRTGQFFEPIKSRNVPEKRLLDLLGESYAELARLFAVTAATWHVGNAGSATLPRVDGPGNPSKGEAT